MHSALECVRYVISSMDNLTKGIVCNQLPEETYTLSIKCLYGLELSILVFLDITVLNGLM